MDKNIVVDENGVIDDTIKEEPEKAGNDELLSGLQEQLVNVQKELAESKAAKLERDEVVDKFSKAIGFIEGSGTGKYDPATGQIIKVEQEQSGPDPLDQLQSEIDSTSKDLLKQYKDGDITQGEYYEQLQETITPLKEKYRDMQFDRKLNKVKEELTPKDQPKVVSNVAEQYTKLAESYPDIADKDSALFKKMNEIYGKNYKLYSNANQSDPEADPDKYKDLIERSIIELKADGVDIKQQQGTIRNQFASPGSKGYQEPVGTDTELSKQQVSNLVSQGINSKALLSDINKALNSWDNTGNMVMED